MTVGVVDLLEVVEIDEDDGELVVVALRAVDFCIEDEAHVTGVVERGAIVLDGQFVDAFDVARIFERDGGEVGKGFEKLEVAWIEAVWADAVDEFDDAEASVAEIDGDGDDGAGLHFCFFVDLAEEAGVLGSIRDNDDFTVLGDPTGNSLPHFDADIFQGLGSFADGEFKIEFLLCLVEEEEGPVVRAKELVDLFHDGAEYLVELKRRGKRFAELLEHGHFAGFARFRSTARIAAAVDVWKLLDFFNAHERNTLRKGAKLGWLLALAQSSRETG